MYLRHTTREKDGKVHRYWRLVQSVRMGRRVVQKTVAHLGELDEAGRLKARALACSLVGSPEEMELFSDGCRDVTVPVRLKGVRVERSVQFGEVYLALALWRALRFDSFCEEVIEPGREEVPWEKMAALLACARLCEPSSELHIAEDWYRRTALPDLLQLSPNLVNKDRLYRALDQLLPHKSALESHLSRRFGELFTIGRVWIMDRGMASEENIAWLNQTGRRYVIGTPKTEMKQWAPQLADKTKWREIREGIEVQISSGPEGKETFVLCRSRDRAEKEKAMHQRFADRITKAIERLKNRIEKSKKKLNRDTVNRQIGRILQVNQRAAGRFDIKLNEDSTKAGFQLEVKINESFDEWALLSEGTYILRSNITDWSDEQLWKSYIQLTQAEAAFRIQKDQLSIRPIWHQKEERVEAHILVCFLAFAMWKTLEMWQEKSGLGNSPRTILEEFSRMQCHDVILPTTEGTEIRLRCIATPDKAQAALLDRLGLIIPKRMRLYENDPPVQITH